jgi:hypothetical protein
MSCGAHSVKKVPELAIFCHGMIVIASPLLEPPNYKRYGKITGYSV